jgi:hypothetical protein
MTDIPFTHAGHLLISFRDKGEFQCLCEDAVHERCPECDDNEPCHVCHVEIVAWQTGELCTGDGYRWMPGTASIYDP